ncbi:phosphate ABC transporter permease subunit PstC [Stieleria sp. TO1_6]|uniref:phosphate ABC transporter permease subunit PstC n=1 Tax=Stieleria tagensis TaxID=2956795 RepID=UPI00209B6F62|nr:phosphate ABC transporter permease subunit PstC [Stieleria tagensis]MCO8122194.1 phosphate ABC transporter permease subunit PstC [Stieleria tagensis]
MDLDTSSEISRPPSTFQRVSDRGFRILSLGFAWLTILVVLYIIWEIGSKSTPAMKTYGAGFLTGTTWDPNTGEFGILPEIWGTLYSSILALTIGTVFGVAVAIFLTEGYLGTVVYNTLRLCHLQQHRLFSKAPTACETLLKNLVELLAAIPSVVYGLWGIFVVIPMIRPTCNWLHESFSWIPFLGTPLSGPGMLPAALVLAVMILPTIAAISRDALVSVPPKLREASYGLGATRWETLLAVILPTAAGGIFGAVVLAFGRALGETMALAMLVGNANRISVSLFAPGNTLASLLANNFAEAGGDENKVAVLMFAGLVLMAITLVVNMIGALILQRATRGLKGLN